MTPRRWQPAALPLDEADVVLRLERLAYGDNDVAERSYYDWLYRDHPAGEAIVFIAATGDTETPSAGHYIVVPMRVALGGEPVTGSLSLNTLTHPRYRRQGVFVTLAEQVFAECVRRRIAFTYGFPNPSSLPGFVGPLHFADIGRVPLLVVPLDPAALAPPAASPPWRLLVRAGASAGAVLSAVRRRRLAPRARVVEVPADADVWDALWVRLRGKYPVMVVRDRAYVAWRFGRCPTRRYRLYLGYADGAPAGFAATRIGTILGLRAGLLVDFVVAPGRGAEVGPSLLHAALAEFAGAGVTLAAALMPRQSEEYSLLAHAGFLRCPRALEPQPFPVILRSHGRAVPERIADWFLTLGDYDAV